MTKTNVQSQVMAQQSSELRQQVNAEPLKPAVIVGKVELKVQQPRSGGQKYGKPQAPKPVPGAKVVQKKLRRAEAAPQTNAQLMQELQYVKGKLRTAEEQAAVAYNDRGTLRSIGNSLCATIATSPDTMTIAELKKDPAFVEAMELFVPQAAALIPLETIKKLAASDDLVKAIVEDRGVKL